MLALLSWIHVNDASLRQTVRIMVATAAAFGAYKLLGLQQGYWAVFTVLVVMQGSIGSTLGAALDRLIGTLIGAALGGIGLAFHSGNPVQLCVILVVVTGIGGFVAAVRPQLRIAPVTAAIMLLTAPPGLPVQAFVADRIVEIGLGGLIGVLAALLILPARSRDLVVERTVVVLERIGTMLDEQAEALETGTALPTSPNHRALRNALGAVEAAMKDADRERASRLANHGIPSAVPRTLWRVRNDLTQIGRAIDEALPGNAAAGLAAAAATSLRAEGALARRCATALTAVSTVDRGTVVAGQARFAESFDAFRRDSDAQTLDFDQSGRIFGLAFAIGRLHRDLLDLAKRIDEIAGGGRRGLTKRDGPLAPRA
jgi:uncharacterized membrane protein YccC